LWRPCEKGRAGRCGKLYVALNTVSMFAKLIKRSPLNSVSRSPAYTTNQAFIRSLAFLSFGKARAKSEEKVIEALISIGVNPSCPATRRPAPSPLLSRQKYRFDSAPALNLTLLFRLGFLNREERRRGQAGVRGPRDYPVRGKDG